VAGHSTSWDVFRLGFHRLRPEPPRSPASSSDYPDRDRAVRGGFRLRLLRSQ